MSNISISILTSLTILVGLGCESQNSGNEMRRIPAQVLVEESIEVAPGDQQLTEVSFNSPELSDLKLEIPSSSLAGPTIMLARILGSGEQRELQLSTNRALEAGTSFNVEFLVSMLGAKDTDLDFYLQIDGVEQKVASTAIEWISDDKVRLSLNQFGSISIRAKHNAAPDTVSTGPSAPITEDTSNANSSSTASQQSVASGTSTGSGSNSQQNQDISTPPDTIAPLQPSISPASGTLFNGLIEITLIQNATVDENFKEFRYTTSGVGPQNCLDGLASSSGVVSVAATTSVVVKAIACDQSGNKSTEISANYIFDNVPPTAPSIIINSGASFTTSANVNLTLSATDASEMYVTDDSECTGGGEWEAYNTSKSWTLAQTNANVHVYVKYRDSVMNVSECVADSIIHDDTPPTAPSQFSYDTTIDSVTVSPSMQWVEGSDSGSGIDGYEIAIGTTAGGTDVLAFTDVGNVTTIEMSSLSLSFGTTYFASIRAYDAAGFSSEIVQGAGWTPSQSFDDVWTQTGTSPAGRYGHVGLWIGNRFFVWGGQNGTTHRSDGSRLDLETNTWQAISSTNAPSARSWAHGVWTGSKVIIWGGISTGPTYHAQGGIYDPATDTWTAMSTVNIPPVSTRSSGQGMVWTGSKVIVFGGGSGTDRKKGAMYDPISDTWEAIADSTNSHAGSSFHWTGTKFLVWGGIGATNAYKNTGEIYDPVTNTWSDMSVTDAPHPRRFHNSIFTGTKLIVWGGIATISSVNAVTDTGAIYDIENDTWTAISTTNAPSPRSDFESAWTGSKMIVWGGRNTSSSQSFASGGIYDPVTDTWESMATANGPLLHSSVSAWSGTAFIIWGGCYFYFGENACSTTAGGIYR